MLKLSRFKHLGSPALKRPVLIIESDDWGPGPQEQADALNKIRLCLQTFQDIDGRHPVMTIGVILSIPDGKAINRNREYLARYLNESEYRKIIDILLRGVDERVFDLQLHGMAHYWPENLMRASANNNIIKKWLETESWYTEKLPSWLQSRWINGASLPSCPLEYNSIKQAVEEEVDKFHQCFGFSPRVVVPPTFVWDDNVEKAYREYGVEIIITPGRRYAGRDGKGDLTPADREFINGQRLASGLQALIRDIYFEPAVGHSTGKVLEKIACKWLCREPALLETHRFNFLGRQLSQSLNSLQTLLAQTLIQFPQIQFLSSYDLATEMTSYNSTLWLPRPQTVWRRLRS